MSPHGRPVWYVRIGKGARIRVKAEYGTLEFDTAYQAAISGESCQGQLIFGISYFTMFRGGARLA